MKVGETRVSGASAAAAVRAPGRTGRTRSATSAAAKPVGDVTSIMGIPDTELTPKVQAAIQALMEEVTRLRSELENTRQRINYLEHLADQDSLVPVINRRAFVRELSRMMSFSRRYGSSSSLLYFDLNELKQVNDTWGHAAGDAALSRVADVLIGNIRDSDVVGRLGGDEFGVILAQSDDAQAGEKALFLAEKIRESALEWEGTTIALSVSWGAYSFAGDEDAGSALQAADKEMYRQKRAANGETVARP